MGHQSMTPDGKGGPGGGRGSFGSGNSGAGGHQSLAPKVDPKRKSRVSHQPIGHGKSGGRRSAGVGGFDLKPRARKGSDCFITTACTEARGLPDDCEQLRVLRLFRQGYVRDLPDGAEVLAEYDEKAPRIVAAVGALPPALAEAIWEWVFEQIEAAVALIRQWRFDSAYRLYAEACMELEALLLHDPGRNTDPNPASPARDNQTAPRTATQTAAKPARVRKETRVEA